MSSKNYSKLLHPKNIARGAMSITCGLLSCFVLGDARHTKDIWSILEGAGTGYAAFRIALDAWEDIDG